MIDLATARALLDAAETEAAALGVTMTFSVLDAAGHQIALHRMDGAGWLTPDIARGKAYAAAAWREETGTLGPRLAEAAPALLAAVVAQTHGLFTAGNGGVPIRVGGEVAGAMGASGGTAAQDAAVVRAAISAVYGEAALE
ncbi:heme-binding protein [Streptosporangium sp. NPDC051022]|uniref:GlcG/HbpS family heme-binding protein n=1 Tax=Streptosporangium sp. NPDC051022 TaxID=3155752 RepID=UPI00343B991C